MKTEPSGVASGAPGLKAATVALQSQRWLADLERALLDAQPRSPPTSQPAGVATEPLQAPARDWDAQPDPSGGFDVPARADASGMLQGAGAESMPLGGASRDGLGQSGGIDSEPRGPSPLASGQHAVIGNATAAGTASPGLTALHETMPSGSPMLDVALSRCQTFLRSPGAVVDWSAAKNVDLVAALREPVLEPAQDAPQTSSVDAAHPDAEPDLSGATAREAPPAYARRLLHVSGDEQLQINVRDATLDGLQKQSVAYALFDQVHSTGWPLRRVFVNGQLFERDIAPEVQPRPAPRGFLPLPAIPPSTDKE